jgi:hypothetical protein
MENKDLCIHVLKIRETSGNYLILFPFLNTLTLSERDAFRIKTQRITYTSSILVRLRMMKMASESINEELRIS